MIPCLLVAGEKQARDAVRVGLDQTGAFQVDVADDAWAVEIAKTKPYQVVIADSTLGYGTDGLEFLARIRELLPEAELLLVARSKVQGRLVTRDKQKLGIYALIQFPVETLDFFKTIGRLLDRLAGGQPAQTPAPVAAAAAPASPAA
jgi:DNA-binding response OmpR family regulator